MMTKLIRRNAVQVAALAVLLTFVAIVAADRVPDLGDCQELQAPEGHKVAFISYAEGFQIYRWTGAAWTFSRPEAVLYAAGEDAEVIGIHYAGPTWQSESGSKVVGEVDRRCKPDANSIDWLRLKAKSSEGAGIFNGVTYIQRLYTVGGLAPAEDGDFVGEEARVPYTALYVFYRD